ncbi:MAG: putative DNA binding domain-containing protein [Gemmatimonadota bacterium]|nr:putative DNA binding domain-containing protein [Gemmatimonadota bacterium]MDE2865358.1 putative DNA binding domain-containing protein [Gemmatimonadota bacterium]
MSNLRINLDDLLHARTVESERIEFKATWDRRVTGHQVLKTICAFANDLRRHGSGYVILGVAEKDGRADLPPRGLTPEQMDEADRWITGRCRTMEPRYVPRISREEKDGRRILVVWVPASETPPHRAPDGDKGARKYWVRVDDRTVDADAAGLLTQLHEQSAVVPWDTRMATDATVDDISETKVREHLRACGSALSDEPDARHIYRKMDIVRRVNDHELPLNVALLFFSRDPSRWFSGAAIETSILQSGAAGETFRDKTFSGGLAEQVRGCLDYLHREVIGSRIDKVPDQVSALNRPSYPEDALREVLVNAVFHRGYGNDTPHTTLVRVMSDRIDIRSTPGPVPGIDLDQLQRGATPRLVPPRNPQIGELFKEIGLAEKRLTGLDKVYRAMERNGSPPPRFGFDEQRTFFQATLFAHPWQSAESAIRRAGELRAVGRPDEARDALETAWRGDPASHVLAEELIRDLVAGGDLDRAEPMIETALSMDPESQRPEVIVPWLEALVADGQGDRVRRFLFRAAGRLSPHEAIGAAIVARRLRESELAARLFDVAGSAILRDPRALLECAQNKLWQAGQAHREGVSDRNRALLGDARILLERLLRMDASNRRHAWAWRELARARRWLGEPTSAVDEAYANATRLAPDETRFLKEWGRSTERGSLALLEWQGRQLAELQVPEHLYGRAVLDEAEFAKQSATLEALRQSADKLKAALAAAVENPAPRAQHLLKDLATAESRLEGSGPMWLGTGLEVAKKLTQAIVAAVGPEPELSADAGTRGSFAAVARALADLNMRYLEGLGPHRP